MSNSNSDDPKLIVDEDWKTQVQREKEMAAKQGDSASELDSETKESAAEMPAANFELLVTMLATQAMVGLGQFPGPDGKLAKVDKGMAKHFIDLLGVLETKTEGNLEPHEKRMLSEILHSLRMGFVSA
jgi:hypothetical protein